MDAAQKMLSPQQQKAVSEELGKTGGVLTKEAQEALKARPEFKGLTPQDIMKGKEILEAKDKQQQPAEKKDALLDSEMKVIGAESRLRSLFERMREQSRYQNVETDLAPFGYDFFRGAAVRVATDRKDIPVPLKYVVGPGDEVKLLLWGRLNGQYNLTVDRDGKITLPQIGPISVAGLTFEQMSAHLIKQTEQIVGTNIDITMGSLKTIPIFVLGDVRRPGAYTIGSFATITDALLIAGGPTLIGSMRNIQLKRKDKVITTFDLYDLLLKGDKSKDMMLQAGDVIFVPVTGPLVGIAGNVKRPAIYELKKQFDLQTMIDLAGGIIPTAYTQQIQIERVQKNERHIVVDINDKHLDKTKRVSIQDADLVKIFSIVDRDLNTVYLNGNVKKPGKYEHKPGLRILDILKDPADLLPETYLDYALIKRLVPPNMESVLIPFSIRKLLIEKDPAMNMELSAADNIYIFNKWFFKDRPYVTTEGQVRAAGRLELVENFRVKDAILSSGDLTRDAYVEKGEIIRVDPNKKYKTIYFNVAKALSGDPQHNVILQDQDKIIIHSIWEHVYKKEVSVDGEVFKPGKINYTDGMRIKDLVFKAGSTLESAYLDDAEITSMIIEKGSRIKYERRNINLRKALEGDPAHNVLLSPYDRLFIKRIPDWRESEFAKITGEVKFPGTYQLKKGERLSSLIERAGGYTDKAYLRGAYFTRERVRELQQKSLEEMKMRLERDLLSEAAVRTASTVNAGEIQTKQVELEQKRKLIESFAQVKATGRMTIKLAHLRLLKGSEFDIPLENGDTLNIPEVNSVVNVVGSVMSMGSFVYNKRLEYSDYIDMTGGYARHADKSNTFVLKVDGSAHKVNKGFLSWSSKRDRWELDGYGENTKGIEPGDVIIVPEKVDTIAWMREIKDITQILMNMAVTAGVVIKLF